MYIILGRGCAILRDFSCSKWITFEWNWCFLGQNLVSVLRQKISKLSTSSPQTQQVKILRLTVNYLIAALADWHLDEDDVVSVRVCYQSCNTRSQNNQQPCCRNLWQFGKTTSFFSGHQSAAAIKERKVHFRIFTWGVCVEFVDLLPQRHRREMR